MEMKMGPDGKLSELSARGEEAVKIGGQIANAHFRSHTALRIGLYILATLLVIASCFLIVFAPDGRETSSIFLGATLIVIGLGCAGFGTFSLKAPGISLDAQSPKERTPNLDLDNVIAGRAVTRSRTVGAKKNTGKDIPPSATPG